MCSNTEIDKKICAGIVSLSPWPKVACSRQCRQSSPVRTLLAIAKLWLISPYPTEYIPLPTRKDEDNSPHVSHRGMGSLRRSHHQGSGGNHRWELLSPSQTSNLCWVGPSLPFLPVLSYGLRNGKVFYKFVISLALIMSSAIFLMGWSGVEG